MKQLGTPIILIGQRVIVKKLLVHRTQDCQISGENPLTVHDTDQKTESIV